MQIVKYIIHEFNNRYYYDEILPRIDLQTVALGLEREKMYNEWFPFVDYGIDLEDLHDREKGILQ